MQEHIVSTFGEARLLYSGCLKIISQIGSSDLDTILDTFTPQCEVDRFLGHEKAITRDDIDPNLLKAECIRMDKQMRLQKQLLGDEALATPERICTVFVEVVVPIVHESGCFRYLEDIEHRVALEVTKEQVQITGEMKKAYIWPAIIHAKEFPDAFTATCEDHEYLVCIVDQTGEACDDNERKALCEKILADLQAKDFSGHTNIVDVYADICPILHLEEESLMQMIPTTARARKAKIFHKAAEKAAVLQRQGQKATFKQQAGMKHGVGAILAKRLAAKRSNTGWAMGGKAGLEDGGSLRSEGEYYCCDKIAQTKELGVEVSFGISYGFGYALSAGGFYKNDGPGDTCRVLESDGAHTHCVSAGPDKGIDIGFSEGYFNSAKDISGTSQVVGANVALGLAVGGGVILDTAGKKIGWYAELGIGLGVDVSTALCETDNINPEAKGGVSSGVTSHFTVYDGQNGKERFPDDCPCNPEKQDCAECFPADATVQTPEGMKFMKDLRVGDRVLASNGQGELFFDDVYFFGHADPEKVKPYIQLTTDSEELFISKDHFIPTCPVASRPCTYEQRVFAYSRTVQAGDYVWVKSFAAAHPLQLERVTQVASMLKAGLYNPYTLSGNMIVNDVVVSSHSSWILDSWVPGSFTGAIPSLYQLLFFPGRVLYSVAGPVGADLLDMNNPQHSPDNFGYGPHFLLLVFVGLVAGMVDLLGIRCKSLPK